MGYAMAGLLAGLGKGIENFGKTIEDRRTAAIAAAKAEASEARASQQRQAERAETRQWQKEDQTTEQANAIARLDKGQAGTIAVQANRQDYDSKESDKDRSYRAAEANKQRGHEANMTERRAVLAERGDAAARRQVADIDAGKIQSSYTNLDGNLVLVYGRGRTEVTETPGERERPAAAAVDPITGLPVTPATIQPPTKAGVADPKYNPYIETMQYVAKPGMSREDIRRATFDQAQKYNLPTPPRELAHAKKQKWIK